MATRFDAFTAQECNILIASLCQYTDSAFFQNQPINAKLVNGGAPSRDNLLTEIRGATNFKGRHQDIDYLGGSPTKQ